MPQYKFQLFFIFIFVSLQAVCSRSHLAAAHSGERLSSLIQPQPQPQTQQQTQPAAQNHPPGEETHPPAAGAGGRAPSHAAIAARSSSFEANASDVFLSTSASLEPGQLTDDARVTNRGDVC